MIRARKLYEARARIAKSLAHPTRLLLLDALKEKEMCVCDLTELAGVDQSTVSKHLAILKEAGLVGVRRDKAMSFYHVQCKCLDGFFGCMEAVLQENLRVQKSLVSM